MPCTDDTSPDSLSFSLPCLPPVGDSIAELKVPISRKFECDLAGQVAVGRDVPIFNTAVPHMTVPVFFLLLHHHLVKFISN